MCDYDWTGVLTNERTELGEVTVNHLPRMRTQAALLGAVLSSGCVTMDAVDTPAYLAAGTRAEAPVVWRGIQACRGELGDAPIAATSDEVAIGDYDRTDTRVAIRGVHLGPSAEFSCGPVDLIAAITHNAGGLTTFLNDDTEPCVSSTGIGLLVSGFSGSAIELRRGAQGFERTLKFSAHIATSEDAGVTDAAFITCSFELRTR